MRYVSTRGAWSTDPQPFCSILLEGLAPDGGLAVPQTYARFNATELAALRPLPYPELALAVLARFIDDIPRADLERLVRGTYTPAVFGSTAITPLTTLEPGLHLLHLSNGPTLAFKDVALQLLGNVFEYVLARERRVLNVVGATSGDTGSAAEHALKGRRGIAVFMLSPHGRMSAFQRAQMYSLTDANIHNLAIDGTFDDCQDIVKAINADAAFKARHAVGAVNSINWGRIAAQVVYYFAGYFAATRGDHEAVDFAVPSGNFGNILAGYVARALGLPIRRLILATNENDVLDEFFRTGRYRPRSAAETHATSSPSMDIAKASNFERFIFDVVGRDAATVRRLWDRVAREGGFDLAATPYWPAVQAEGFASRRSTHADRVATIRAVHERFGVIIDPHTADGVKAALDLREPGIATICLETALPAKFGATIREALGTEPPRPAGFAGLEDKPQRVTVLPVDVARVQAYIGKHAVG